MVPQRALLGPPAARPHSRLMLRPSFPHTSPEHSCRAAAGPFPVTENPSGRFCAKGSLSALALCLGLHGSLTSPILSSVVVVTGSGQHPGLQAPSMVPFPLSLARLTINCSAHLILVPTNPGDTRIHPAMWASSLGCLKSVSLPTDRVPDLLFIH